MKATTRFRQLLAEPGIITAPGAYDCLTAAIIERTGFPAVYMTGAGTSVARIATPTWRWPQPPKCWPTRRLLRRRSMRLLSPTPIPVTAAL